MKEIARALTGWTYNRVNTAIPLDYYNRDYTAQQPLNPVRFDTGAKTFLGQIVPDKATQQANVDAVVNAVFNHPNTSPYISKRLIQ